MFVSLLIDRGVENVKDKMKLLSFFLSVFTLSQLKTHLVMSENQP